jgi:hypothetical protein
MTRPPSQNQPRTVDTPPRSASSVTSRDVVSAPSRVIQVERVRVSDAQRSSVTVAIRTGRTSR